jgi:hypothetical protein
MSSSALYELGLLLRFTGQPDAPGRRKSPEGSVVSTYGEDDSARTEGEADDA